MLASEFTTKVELLFAAFSDAPAGGKVASRDRAKMELEFELEWLNGVMKYGAAKQVHLGRESDGISLLQFCVIADVLFSLHKQLLFCLPQIIQNMPVFTIACFVLGSSFSANIPMMCETAD